MQCVGGRQTDSWAHLVQFWPQMLYAFSPDGGPEQAQTINVLKGLSVAVRGVLDSICGEKVRPPSLAPVPAAPAT